MAAPLPAGSPLVGFTLKGAPLSTKPRASTPGPHCCFPSTSRCKTIGLFRPCGVSPLRRFTPRSGRQFIAPGYRQGFIASAPSAATEVVASGRLATPHPRKNVPVGSPALLREHPLALAFQQPDTEVSENNAHTSPPPKRCGCGAARDSPACTRGRRPMCVEHKKAFGLPLDPPDASAKSALRFTRVPIASTTAPKHC